MNIARHSVYCLVMVALLGAQLCAQNMQSVTVDELVGSHVKALGGKERIDAIQTLIFHGVYREGTFEMPDAYLAKMRPYYRVVGDPESKNGQIREGYDGSAWEYYADPGVVVRTVGAAAAAARHGTEFIDSLVDYKERRSN